MARKMDFFFITLKVHEVDTHPVLSRFHSYRRILDDFLFKIKNNFCQTVIFFVLADGENVNSSCYVESRQVESSADTHGTALTTV